jgi:hypothetical protein
VRGTIAGVRAPALKRAAPKAWTDPEPLFNGKDLTGWVTVNNTQNPRVTASHWVVKDGELVDEAQGHRGPPAVTHTLLAHYPQVRLGMRRLTFYDHSRIMEVSDWKRTGYGVESEA